MSSNNNNDGGALIVPAFIFVALYILGLVIYALACFLALIGTIIALMSWDKKTHLFGHELCTPEEARIFIGCGIVGAIALTSFVYFCSLLFGFRFEEKWVFYLLTGGYSFASIGIGMQVAENAKAQTSTSQSAPVIEHQPTLPVYRPEPPFMFASWDDEKPKDETTREPCRGGCRDEFLAKTDHPERYQSPHSDIRLHF